MALTDADKLNKNWLLAWAREFMNQPMPEHWYDDPIDRMLVFLGERPRKGAKYTVPKD